MKSEFGGFVFDNDVFGEWVAEKPYIKTDILRSGVLVESQEIKDLVGGKNVAGTIPIYKPLDAEADPPLEFDGVNDNTPVETSGAYQSFSAYGSMKAWKAKEMTGILSGAKPIENVANNVASYFAQDNQKRMMGIVDTVLTLDGLENHTTDLSITEGSVTDKNKITETSGIDLCAKACGDMADQFSLVLMNSRILAALKIKQLIEYVKYTDARGILPDVTLPTWDGKIVTVDDRGTVDTSKPGFPVYKTYFMGAGSILTAPKEVKVPYYTEYDAKTAGGTDILYAKQMRVLHPNGFSFEPASLAQKVPSRTELQNKSNWKLAWNEKNIAMAVLKTNG